MGRDKRLPPVALGTWAWGDDVAFGDGPTREQLRPVFDAAMEHGLNLWDTAYVYGMGTSEKILGSFLRELPGDAYILSDKLTPQCMDRSSSDPIRGMLETESGFLGVDSMDLLWIHNPVHAPKWIRAVAEYFEDREDAPMIGVSNHDLAQIRQAEEILREHSLKLSGVQNHFSLLNRTSEQGGILEHCRENGILFFAYMVLEQGALTGSYHPGHPLPEGSDRARCYNGVLKRLEPLNAKLMEIGGKHDANATQAATAWAIAKGTLPIIGVTKVKHVEDAAGAAQIILSPEEIAELEDLADQTKVSTIRGWERSMAKG